MTQKFLNCVKKTNIEANKDIPDIQNKVPEPKLNLWHLPLDSLGKPNDML